MVCWDFDNDDPDTVWVRDPEFDESPGLAQRLAQDRHSGIRQAAMLRPYIADLHPQDHCVFVAVR